MCSSAVYDMYDQLTICILKRNFIYLEDYAWPLKPSKHDTLTKCWADVVDVGPTLIQHSVYGRVFCESMCVQI